MVLIFRKDCRKKFSTRPTSYEFIHM